ncbi:hypothetical protein [uncultured Helicobacter sp.]|uniref:hypothetical protein n=1 Tax=uncultured Helicobacter sp. TaxID=175537 RepID=UPI00261EB8B8|nr:hypothetical protein [uncultured Helicobacter sp.]
MMKIDDISRKALQKLETSKKPPTPLAYFETFYEIAKREGGEQIEELNWQKYWLNKFDFDKNAQEQLKAARNPNEFIDMLASILKETKETYSIEHTHQLKTLIRKLLGIIADVFSIGAKNRFDFLFRSNGLNYINSTKRLIEGWTQFRESKVHIDVLKKIIGIVVFTLRKPNSQGTISKEALELSSMLMMHPQALIELRILERIEKILGIKKIAQNTPIVTEEQIHNSCLALLKVNNVSFLSQGVNIDTKQALSKAMEILKKKCLLAIQNASLAGYYNSGFVLICKDMDTQNVLKEIEPIIQQLEKQKFSYQGVLFALELELNMFNGSEFDTLEELNQKLLSLLDDTLSPSFVAKS